MAIITILSTTAANGGPLYTIVDDLTNLNSQVSRTRDNGNLIIDDTNVDSEQKITIDETNLLAILAQGGEVEEYLFAIEAPLTLAGVTVPVGVPLRTNILGQEKTFTNWFLPGAEVWRNTGTGRLVFYTNPHPAGSDPLKASEAELIRQIDTNDINFLTIAEAQTLVAGAGWVKL